MKKHEQIIKLIKRQANDEYEDMLYWQGRYDEEEDADFERWANDAMNKYFVLHSLLNEIKRLGLEVEGL